MTKQRRHDQVRSRNEPFTQRTITRLWSEQASDDNPYIAKNIQCHGYDLFDLMDKCSFVEMFYLLFRGELPSAEESEILQTLMVALINPGPRHPATRAAMNVGVGKTDPINILPIASAVLGGKYLGGGEVEQIIRFYRKNQRVRPDQYVQDLFAERSNVEPGESLMDESCVLGYGRLHGGVDLIAKQIAERLVSLPGSGSVLAWGHALAELLEPRGIGWLLPGVAAAVFADLGFQPRFGGALYQLLGAPGLVAHGLELANKPITAMPFVRDQDYVVEQ